MRKLVRRRQAHLRRSGKAVSPVVATLILILIAVAAAAALYLWLVAFQGGVTNGIGSGGKTQYTVSIGGSTSVFPFTEAAIPQFEQNNSGISVTDNQGGTGAGMLAVCHGAVDIGTASSPQVAATLEASDGCPSTVTITTVAYDAVDIIVPSANTHGLFSMSQSTLEAVYVAASGGTTAFTVSGYTYSVNGATAANSPVPAATGFIWGQIPACAQAATTCSGTAFAADTPIAAGVTTPCTTATAAICYTAAGSPCGWNVCAGGTVANTVQPWHRADTSGTEQTFTARLMGIGASGGVPSGLGFGGCGSDGQLASCGLTVPKSAQGNPGVIEGVAGSVDALGFASDGLARAAGSNVAIIPFQGYGQTVVVTPTTGHSGSISAGIQGVATGYVGWRPFEYVTQQPPSGEVQRFIQFVLFPNNNLNLASESQEISVYSI